jgi:hypothetical protein
MLPQYLTARALKERICGKGTGMGFAKPRRGLGFEFMSNRYSLSIFYTLLNVTGVRVNLISTQ